MINHIKSNNFRNLFVGLESSVPLLDGTEKCYINFDNAASTPAMRTVQRSVNDFLSYYSSVHRGTGFKSLLSTHAYEQARKVTLRFLGADPGSFTCIFGKNTTEAINKLTRRFPITDKRYIVLTSGMEHHSNDLPWRSVAKTIHTRLAPDGQLDEADFDTKLNSYRDKIAIVAITGASNVTGYINPIHRLAEKAHKVGAQIIVDCAQLAPHRKIDMGSLDDPAHLDYVTISAHKLYAPFGTGALIGRKDTFESGDPDVSGGGTVEIVTLNDVVWADPPERDEAGSPNTIGAIALASAIYQLEQVSMETIANHEASLTAYALERLKDIPQIHIYGDCNSQYAHRRLGVIPFQLDEVSHFLVAAILGYEFGIGVRSGCFCAHPYILHLLGLSDEQARDVRMRILKSDRRDMPGMIRASFGLYNTTDEIDNLIEALTCIAQRNYKGHYIQQKATGEYIPEGWNPDYKQYFSFEGKNAGL